MYITAQNVTHWTAQWPESRIE